MSGRPMLSVIVPTCDRAGPLEACLKTLITQDCPELEIVVSDNASGPETARVLGNIDDPRLSRFRVEKRLGMAEHFEFALGHAKGDWITFLGDDDGLMPGAAARFIELSESIKADAICSARCTYLWPEANGGEAGVLRVPAEAPDENRDSREWMTAVVKGKKGYGSLPWVYEGGFVKRSVMDGIKSRMGRYFSSMNLDAYSAMAVASVLPSYHWHGSPLAIAGTCAKSNGQLWLDGKELKTSEFQFLQETELPFHPTLGDGNVFSMSLLTYEAFLQSEPLRDFEVDTDLAEQIRIALLTPKRKMRAAVESYCRAIAKHNDMDFEKIKRQTGALRLGRSLAKKVKKISGQTGLASDPWAHKVESPQLSDVFLASQMAGELTAGEASTKRR